LDRLVEMMDEDWQMARIAPDFTWRQDILAWPRPESEWGISKGRWDDYRSMFRKVGAKDGTTRRQKLGHSTCGDRCRLPALRPASEWLCSYRTALHRKPRLWERHARAVHFLWIPLQQNSSRLVHLPRVQLSPYQTREDGSVDANRMAFKTLIREQCALWRRYLQLERIA
jgi:hypothetical protein